ncbi:MAG: hypothetical protein R3239_03645, partial [Thermodesulfobacteriota bacterium]|nr:hypothetical protein [Thermodesulfobacteriota bacterium]
MKEGDGNDKISEKNATSKREIFLKEGMVRKSLLLLGIFALLVPLVFLGCEGDDGSNGSNGFNTLVLTSTEDPGTNCANGGQKIQSGLDTNRNGELDDDEVTSTSYVCNGAGIAQAQAESCSVCHGGNPEADGSDHQAYYDQLYQDGPGVGMEVTGLAYANDGVNDTVTFTMTKAGVDFDCTLADSLGVYFVAYDNATRTFNNDNSARLSLSSGTKVYDGAGG